jgi:ABC-type polysaccharide/polyol phosphate transport system ATPase subunit
MIAGEVRSLRAMHLMSSAGRVVQGDEIEVFLALENVDFEIKQGEAAGIIGRNVGAEAIRAQSWARHAVPIRGATNRECYVKERLLPRMSLVVRKPSK